MRKLTRQRLERFLATHATEEHIVNIGPGNLPHFGFFPNQTRVDIDPDCKPDIVADAAHIPLPDSSTGIVLSIDMLEHAIDPVAVVDEMYRVMRPGGKLIFCTRFIYPLHDAPGDYWRFTRPVLENLFRSFSKVSIEPEAGTFTTLGILLERISMQSDVRGGKLTKAVFLGMSRLLCFCDGLIRESYGDIARRTKVKEILASGYHVVAYK